MGGDMMKYKIIGYDKNGEAWYRGIPTKDLFDVATIVKLALSNDEVERLVVWKDKDENNS